jgi:hypothetical protein
MLMVQHRVQRKVENVRTHQLRLSEVSDATHHDHPLSRELLGELLPPT